MTHSQAQVKSQISISVSSKLHLKNQVQLKQVGIKKSINIPIEIIVRQTFSRYEVHTWSFFNRKEAEKFKTSTESHIHSFDTVLKRRYSYELSKVQSFLEQFCQNKTPQLCSRRDRKRILNWMKKTNIYGLGETHIFELNTLFSKLVRKFYSTRHLVNEQESLYPFLIGFFNSNVDLKLVKIKSENLLVQTNLLSQMEWFQIMGYNPAFFKEQSDCPDNHQFIHNVGLCVDRPIESVTFQEVQNFIEKINFLKPADGTVFRLPSVKESQRLTLTTENPKLFDNKITPDQVWHDENSELKTQPIHAKPANPWGLFDMIGHLWQYVEAPMDFVTTSTVLGAAYADKPGFVVRGGSWIDSLKTFSYSKTTKIFEGWTCYDVGFRLVKDLKAHD